MISKFAIGSIEIKEGSGYYLIHEHDGFSLADIRIIMQDKGNRNGARFASALYGKRQFSIKGIINASSKTDLETRRQNLETAFDISSGLKTMTITTRGGVVLTLEVITKNLEIVYKKGETSHNEFLIQLEAENPYLKSSTSNSQNVDIYEGGGGEIPMEIPFSLGTGGTGDTTITNSGNGVAFPVIKIYGAITNPSIRNVTTGEYVNLNYSLSSSSDYIEIDCENGTVKLNGNNNIIQYMSSDSNFWGLASGNNTIRLNASSYETGAYANVVYSNSYLGI